MSARRHPISRDALGVAEALHAPEQGSASVELACDSRSKSATIERAIIQVLRENTGRWP